MSEKYLTPLVMQALDYSNKYVDICVLELSSLHFSTLTLFKIMGHYLFLTLLPIPHRHNPTSLSQLPNRIFRQALLFNVTSWKHHSQDPSCYVCMFGSIAFSTYSFGKGNALQKLLPPKTLFYETDSPVNVSLSTSSILGSFTIYMQ